MKKKKYLPLYEKWSESGKLPKVNGLCNEFGIFDGGKDDWVFPKNPLFELIMPGEEDQRNNAFWAGENDNDFGVFFGPIRQNIVLLMAAMSGEL